MTLTRKLRRCIEKGEKYLAENEKLLEVDGLKKDNFVNVCNAHYVIKRYFDEKLYVNDAISRGKLKIVVQKLNLVYGEERKPKTTRVCTNCIYSSKVMGWTFHCSLKNTTKGDNNRCNDHIWHFDRI